MTPEDKAIELIETLEKLTDKSNAEDQSHNIVAIIGVIANQVAQDDCGAATSIYWTDVKAAAKTLLTN